jgi:hypothetical protein
MLLPTTLTNFQRRYPQRRKMIGAIAYNADHFFGIVAYNLEKCSNFSSCVFFCVVAYTAEKLSTLLTTTQKNVRIRISP